MHRDICFLSLDFGAGHECDIIRCYSHCLYTLAYHITRTRRITFLRSPLRHLFPLVHVSCSDNYSKPNFTGSTPTFFPSSRVPISKSNPYCTTPDFFLLALNCRFLLDIFYFHIKAFNGFIGISSGFFRNFWLWSTRYWRRTGGYTKNFLPIFCDCLANRLSVSLHSWLFYIHDIIRFPYFFPLDRLGPLYPRDWTHSPYKILSCNLSLRRWLPFPSSLQHRRAASCHHSDRPHAPSCKSPSETRYHCTPSLECFCTAVDDDLDAILCFSRLKSKIHTKFLLQLTYNETACLF